MRNIQQINPTYANALSNFSNTLLDNAQQGFELNQRKREDKRLGEYQQNKLLQEQQEAEQKKTWDIFKYNNEQQEKEDKKTANTYALKNLRPDLYENISQEFGQFPTVENANKMNAITGNVDLNLVKPNKPKYNLQKTDKGFVMFDTTNPTAEPILVGGGYKPYENPSSHAGDTRKTTDQLNWLLYNTGLKSKGLPEIGFDEFYQNQQNTKSMGVGLRDADSVKRETERVSKIVNLSPYQMSNHDFSNMDLQQKYEMDNLIAYREQGLKSKVPDWMKKDLDSLSAVVYSAGEVSKSLNSNDNGLIDASLNKVNQYLGLGDSTELAKRTLTQSNYQLYSNFMLKSLSGLAVTKPEESRFTKAFGSLFMEDSVVAMKIKTNMENLAYRLENMKKSYDPIAFNYRYGHLQRNINNAVQNMNSTIESYNNNSPIPTQSYVTSDGSQYQSNQNKEINFLNMSQPKIPSQADNSHITQDGQTKQRTVVRRGTYQGQRVIEYSDGSVEYE